MPRKPKKYGQKERQQGAADRLVRGDVEIKDPSFPPDQDIIHVVTGKLSPDLMIIPISWE